jgi:hypothetical protein
MDIDADGGGGSNEQCGSVFFASFCTKKRVFAKTGSGQIKYRKVETKDVSAGC